MSATVGVGVIGAGNMGADHARTLARSVSGAQVRVVADLDPGRAAACAREVGDARSTGDALALIADPAVEAVVVASHDSTHAALTLAAVRAGKPVLCEKPLAPTLDEAVAVVAQLGPEGAGLLSLGFMRRFDPGYVALRAALDDGTVGRPLVVQAGPAGDDPCRLLRSPRPAARRPHPLGSAAGSVLSAAARGTARRALGHPPSRW